jgi:hypothetical protein
MVRPAMAWVEALEGVLAGDLAPEGRGHMEEALAGGGRMPRQEDGMDLPTLRLTEIHMP